jgi:hypothetical protein
MMTIFWDIVPCSPVGVHQGLKSAYCLGHQGTDGTVTGMRQ